MRRSDAALWLALFERILGRDTKAPRRVGTEKVVVEFIRDQRLAIREVEQNRNRRDAMMRKLARLWTPEQVKEYWDCRVPVTFDLPGAWASAQASAHSLIQSLTSRPSEGLCLSLAEFIVESVLVPDFNEPDLVAQTVNAIAQALAVRPPSPYRCYQMECEMKGRAAEPPEIARSHVERWRRGFAHKFRRDLLDQVFVDGTPQRLEFAPRRRRQPREKA